MISNYYLLTINFKLSSRDIPAEASVEFPFVLKRSHAI